MTVKRLIKWVLLLAPLAVWLAMAGACSLDKAAVKRQLRDADGTVLVAANDSLQIQVDQTVEGEVTRYVIRALAPDGGVRHEWRFAADGDMFGGGFVAATDLNADGQPEILAWGAHESRRALMIDVHPETHALRHRAPPEKATQLGRRWHRTHVMRPMELGLYLVPLALYYVLAAVILIIARAMAHRKPLSAQDTAETEPTADEHLSSSNGD